MRDNVFHHSQTADWSDIPVPHRHNAFVACILAGWSSDPATEPILTDLVFDPGPFGSNYLPASATQLVNQGSRTAADAGLYHYTTSKTAGSKEGNEPPSPFQVNIGLHCVAAGPDGKPLDSDTDGIPDHLEDKNGNGLSDGDETSFQYADTDYDGRNDGQELLEDGTNPLHRLDQFHHKGGKGFQEQGCIKLSNFSLSAIGWRRGPGGGGACSWIPLSSVLSPLVPRGERKESLMQPCSMSSQG